MSDLPNRFHCPDCSEYFNEVEVSQSLVGLLRIHHCPECNGELSHQCNVEDANLDDMQEALDDATDLRRQLVIAHNTFLAAKEEYFACWKSSPLEWEGDEDADHDED